MISIWKKGKTVTKKKKKKKRKEIRMKKVLSF